jgi:hypothetical protein
LLFSLKRDIIIIVQPDCTRNGSLLYRCDNARYTDWAVGK